MQYSSLMSFLNGFASGEQLASEIRPEVAACLAALSKGGSGPVIITDGPVAIITRKQVERFVEALAEGRLPLNTASYVADALILSDNFDFANEFVSDVVHFLSDDTATLTLVEVQALRQRLLSAA